MKPLFCDPFCTNDKPNPQTAVLHISSIQPPAHTKSPQSKSNHITLPIHTLITVRNRQDSPQRLFIHPKKKEKKKKMLGSTFIQREVLSLSLLLRVLLRVLLLSPLL